MRRFALAALPAAALALSGCHRPAGPPPGQAPPGSANAPAPRDRATVYVVDPKARGDADPLMPRTVRLAHPGSPAREAVAALLVAPGGPMPRGTALRGMTLEAGVATLDFSRSPVDETGGEGHQSDALAALGRTLGQFPEITAYRVQVKGKPVDTFGEFVADGPIPVTRAGGGKPSQ